MSSDNPTPGSKTSEPSGWRPSLDAYEKTLVEAADAVARFCADVEAGARPYSLALSGATGCGKTFLSEQLYRAARVHRDAATKDWPAQSGVYDERRRRPFYRWIDESTFARLIFDDRQYDLPEHVAHEWLVCYDDLGTKTFATAGTRESFNDALFRLANQRLGKWTIWSTNLSLEEISNRIDARLASRLIRDGNRFVTIKAGDYALRRRAR